MEEMDLQKANDRAFDMVFKGMVDFYCLKGAHDLGLFKLLAHESLDAPTIARLTESKQPRLERFLLVLSQIGLVQEQEGRWALTPFASQFFACPEEHRNLTMVPFLEYYGGQFADYYQYLADVVRGRKDYTSVTPYPPRSREDSLFYETIHRSNLHFPMKLLVERAQLQEARHLIDVGGGIGDLATRLCRQFPELKVTLINLPSAMELIQENLAEQGVNERVTPLVLDMYRDSYPQGDAVLFSRILYPMEPKFCSMLCQKAYDALTPGGRLLILDMIISDPEKPNYDYLSHYIGAIGMEFSVLSFKSHTVYPEILSAVGFSDIQYDEAYDYVLYQAIKPGV